MPTLLFVDDEPDKLEWALNILSMTLSEAQIDLTETVEDTIQKLTDKKYDLMIMDIFIPMGKDAMKNLGPRTRKYEENMRHLGGLAILDYIEKMPIKPKILAHTACTDFALIEILGDLVHDRIPKPASVETLVNEIKRALNE